MKALEMNAVGIWAFILYNCFYLFDVVADDELVFVEVTVEVPLREFL